MNKTYRYWVILSYSSSGTTYLILRDRSLTS